MLYSSPKASIIESQLSNETDYKTTQDMTYYVLQKLKHLALMNEDFEKANKATMGNYLDQKSFQKNETIEILLKINHFLLKKNQELENELKTLKKTVQTQNATNKNEETFQSQILMFKTQNARYENLVLQIERQLTNPRIKIETQTIEKLKTEKVDLYSIIGELKQKIVDLSVNLNTQKQSEKEAYKLFEQKITQTKSEVKEINEILKEFKIDSLVISNNEINAKSSIFELYSEVKCWNRIFEFLELEDILILSHASKLLRFKIMVDCNFLKLVFQRELNNQRNLSLFYRPPELNSTIKLLETTFHDKQTLKIQTKRFLQHNYNPSKFLVTELKNSIEKLHKFNKKSDANPQVSNSNFSGSILDKLKSKLNEFDLKFGEKNDFMSSFFDAKFIEALNEAYMEPPKMNDINCLEKLRLFCFDLPPNQESSEEYCGNQNKIFAKSVESKSLSFGQFLYQIYENFSDGEIIRKKNGLICFANL